MANDYVDDCMFTPASGGTGNFVFSAAVTGYRSPVGLATNGAIYEYRAQSVDLSQWENGFGAWTAATNTLARTTITASSNAGAAVVFTNPPQVGLTILSASIKSLLRVDQAQSFTDAQKNQGLANLGAIVRGQLHGLTLSTAGASATFSVALGQATSDDFSAVMVLAASISKTTGAWAVGTGNGALDTGTIAINTWYHAYLIERTDTGVVDVLISLSATAPTMPTNYTRSRRIGAMKTNASSQWTSFTQVGDVFKYLLPSYDVQSVTPTTASRTLYALNVPTGINVQALIRVQLSGTSAVIVLTSPLETDGGLLFSGGSAISLRTTAAGDTTAGEFAIITDTSGQVGGRAAAAGATLQIATHAWIDRRGRDA